MASQCHLNGQLAVKAFGRQPTVKTMDREHKLPHQSGQLESWARVFLASELELLPAAWGGFLTLSSWTLLLRLPR